LSLGYPLSKDRAKRRCKNYCFISNAYEGGGKLRGGLAWVPFSARRQDLPSLAKNLSAAKPFGRKPFRLAKSFG
jgi:hypothetical protein